MIRIRRIPQRIPIGRRYEMELPPEQNAALRRIATRAPTTILAPLVGIGDAWAFVNAADRAWDGQSGEWIVIDDSWLPEQR